MGILSGSRLRLLTVALMAVAAAAAVRVAVSSNPRRAIAPGTPAGLAADAASREHVEKAVAAEREGNIAAAVAHYRAAVSLDPRCVDRRSTAFLGPAFEKKVKTWVDGMKSGRIAGGPAALSDASFIFRRLYGGCG